MSKMASRIELWKTDKLKPYKNNARTHSEEQVIQIMNSIKEFGFNNPILVDSGEGIIAGHGRFEAAQKLGLEKVPVIVLDHLTDKQRRAYIIADNKIAENSDWDEDLLAQEIEALMEDDFDVEVTGFTEKEIEGLIEDGEWESDIESVEKVEKNLTGINAVVKVICPSEMKTEVKNFIVEQIINSGFEGIQVV